MLKKILLLLFTFTSLTHAVSNEVLEMRIAVFSTISSYMFLYKQNKNQLKLPFSYKTDSMQFGFFFGKEIGCKDRKLHNMQISLILPWKHKVYKKNNLLILGATEISISKYLTTLQNAYHPKGYIYSIVPMFQYNHLVTQYFKTYFKVGIGIAFIDKTIVENREKSTHFQFDDNIGFGISYNAYSLGYKFTHISNLGIKKPNPGLDFHQLELQFRF